MTVTLERQPDTEAVAKAAAQSKGVAVEDYLTSFLETALPRPALKETELIRQQRIEILNRLQGKYAGLPGGSEEFSAQKEEEKVREERRGRADP